MSSRGIEITPKAKEKSFLLSAMPLRPELHSCQNTSVKRLHSSQHRPAFFYRWQQRSFRNDGSRGHVVPPHALGREDDQKGESGNSPAQRERVSQSGFNWTQRV